MLSLEDLKRLSAKLKIDRERIAREYYELLVLNEISENSWSKNLIFKGGTALRLAYGSPRFSDDLDFSYTKTIRADDIFTFISNISAKYDLKVRETVEKRDTILAEFSIRHMNIPQAFRLKLEVSKRRSKTLQYEVRLLRSPVTPFEVLFNVQTLESILSEKLNAIRDRNEPRDIFDIWYICKKLDQTLPVMPEKTDVKRFKQTLHKYLPKQLHSVLDEITKEIKRTR